MLERFLRVVETQRCNLWTWHRRYLPNYFHNSSRHFHSFLSRKIMVCSMQSTSRRSRLVNLILVQNVNAIFEYFVNILHRCWQLTPKCNDDVDWGGGQNKYQTWKFNILAARRSTFEDKKHFLYAGISTREGYYSRYYGSSHQWILIEFCCDVHPIEYPWSA